MKSLGENPTENELQGIINAVDIDGKSQTLVPESFQEKGTAVPWERG